jgi:hypothetical protein
MKVVLKQRNYPSKNLRLSKQILDNLKVNIEKILYTKVIIIPKSSSQVITPEVITISLDRDFNIRGRDDLVWKYYFLRSQFIGSIKDTKAVFTVTVRGIDKDRRDYGDIEIYAYNNDFDGFDELFRKVKPDLKPLLSVKGIKYFVIGSLDSRVYDLDKIIAFSSSDVKSFLSVIMRFLKEVSLNGKVEKRINLLNSLPTNELLELVYKSFEEKGYYVLPESLTVYGDKPLLDGFLNFLNRL